MYTRPAQVDVQGGVVVNGGMQGGGQCVCAQGAQEVCNGCDDNCNGIVDEGCGGGGVAVTSSVAQPSGGVVYHDPHPQPVPVQCVCRQGAQEVCGNGCDDNCNGSIDEGC